MDAFEEHDVNDLGLSIENLDEIGDDTPQAPLYFEVESDEKLKLNKDDKLFANNSDEKLVGIDDEEGVGGAESLKNKEDCFAGEGSKETGEQLDECHSTSGVGVVINDINEKLQCSEEDVEISQIPCDDANAEIKIENYHIDHVGESRKVGDCQTNDHDADVVDGSKDTRSEGGKSEVEKSADFSENRKSDEIADTNSVAGKVDDDQVQNGKEEEEEKHGNGESQIADLEQNVIDQQVGNLLEADGVEKVQDQESIIDVKQPAKEEEEKKGMQQLETVVSSTPNKDLPKEPLELDLNERFEDGDIYESPIPPSTPEGYSSVKKKNNGTLNSEVSSTDLNDTNEMLRDHYRMLPLPNSPWHSLREEDISKGGTSSSLDRKNYTALIDSDREPSFSGSFSSGIGLKDYERDLSFGISSKKEDGDGQYTSLVTHSKREADARRDALLKPCYVISIGVGHVDFRKPCKRGSKTADFFRSLTTTGDSQLESMLIAWKIS